MKFVLLILAITCCAYASLYSTEEYLKKFVDFQHKYNKTYSPSEFGQRFSIFRANLEKAALKQAKVKGTARFGVTKFSDLTEEEFTKMYLLPKFSAKDWPKHTVAAKVPPPKAPVDDFDWGDKGAITPVYDQGQCGSCWAFSATETIESYWFLAGNTLTELSMQQIVDCDTTDDGCGGGWTYDAYQYVESAGGLEPLADYEYVAQDEQCQFNSADILASISGWSYVTQDNDEGAMYNWVTSNGPLSICVDASSWSSYQGGVLTAADCGSDLDHCVQLTGYSDQDGTEAWNVRNSWGTDWGNSGYIYLERGQNTCGCSDVVTAVTAT